MHSDFRLSKRLREFTKHYTHSEAKFTLKANTFLGIKIFNQMSEIVQRFLGGSGVIQAISQLNIIFHCVYDLTRRTVANAYDIKCVVLVSLFDKLKEFAVVFEGSVHALKMSAIDGIRQRQRYLDFKCFVLIIKFGVKTFG